MIDTDKYEGHTGPWLLVDGDIYKGGPKETHKRDNMIADTAFGGYESIKARYADRLLMADAPLLLQALIDEQAEVKRLRARIEQAIATLRSQPNDLEDGPDYHRELLSFLNGAICHAIDVLEGKE